ncbi:hypothetical protein EUGRSUZ_C01326 [Eucalyptus grandis]|uniref:Disease resistance R13L4/SHOC-2-like LRR domain-containing protein n=2 Tax=Eucalyptus grandis TaxID=71139 RepID=A0A059CPZ0_EUCGR|nr:hypothetical protein EUGRSUZ_C01326 [Eucalyptus grandis]
MLLMREFLIHRKLASLTELHLKGTTIEELPESIGSLKELETLNVSWCKSLTHIPSSVGDQVSLTHLLLQGCHLLKEIPNSIGKLASLTKLDLSETGIEKLPESIGFLKELETLDASNCVLLAHIPSSIGHLSSLSLLDLRKCHKLTQLPESMGSLMSLTHLYLSWTGIEELPKSINSLKKLKILDASNCASLTCISSSIGHPECQSLKEIPILSRKLASSIELDLYETGIKESPFSEGAQDFKCLYLYFLACILCVICYQASLSLLDFRKTWIEELLESISSLKRIKTLVASNCVSLVCILNSSSRIFVVLVIIKITHQEKFMIRLKSWHH